MLDDPYPIWLSEKLVNYSFDWEQAASSSFPALLQTITLHDSNWRYTLLPGDNSMVLVIELDAFWNKNFCHQQEDWPYIIIEIHRTICLVNDFAKDDFAGTIGLAESAIINAARFSEWLEFAKVYNLLPADFHLHQSVKPVLHRTEISTIYGGTLSVTHEAPIKILLYSAAGNLLEVNLNT